MNKIRLIVFDLSGTTIQDNGAVVSAFKWALYGNGIEAKEEELQKWRGASKREVIRHFTMRKFEDKESKSSQRSDKIYRDFCKFLQSAYAKEGVFPVSGAKTTFVRLREQGIKLALTTGFSRKIANFIL